MSSLSEDIQSEDEVLDIPEGSSYSEYLIRQIMEGYSEAWNNTNEDYNIQYFMTITTHKVPMANGENQDVAYLRIDRSITPKAEVITNDGIPLARVEEIEASDIKLVHQEVRPFKNIQERIDPRQLWKQELMTATIARLFSAGLEYAELLNRVKANQKEQEDKAKKSDIIITNEMPKPLTPDEEAYKKWVQQNRTDGLS